LVDFHFEWRFMPAIHPTAVVHPEAEIDSSVDIGPYTVIDEGVTIGPETKIGPHCYITGRTTIGKKNRIHAGCILGDEPQDLAYSGVPTSLVIGDSNIIREHVTIHRGTKEGTSTVLGNENFLLANCHVAHNCQVGNQVIIVNAVLLGGYVEVQDRAFLGGGAVVHQFCRVGELSILRGLARISKDVPPFCMAVENNELVGLNLVGLRRAHLGVEQRDQLKSAYKKIFHSGLNVTQALGEVKGIASGEVQRLVEFIETSKRGICTARHQPTELGEE
jgi:UDP-N-acetylglucosamine acyltransferase